MIEYFETRNKIITLKDDAPEWILDAVRDAHQGTMPHDWIWRECFEACCAIDDNVITDDDSIHGYADGRVNIYTEDLFTWATDMCLTSTFQNASEESEEVGAPKAISDQIAAVQYFAIRYIANVMWSAYQCSSLSSI